MAVDVVGVKYDADISDLRKQLDAAIEENKRLLAIVDKTGTAYTNTSKKAGASINDLTAKERALTKARNESTNPDDIIRYNNEIRNTQTEIAKLSGKYKEANVHLKKTSELQGVISKAGAALVAAFAVEKVIEFAKASLMVSANFEKMGAVLTNTLGSRGAAQAAMNQIMEFAKTTPFQVQELTDSFVKLSNQGFIPTTNEMRKLGDLAASQGKTFDQLTEAIIDAQTGEFERLKEFGIRASKEGDQVKFSFKGVETQTNFTADAMREYILSLGDLEGVSGGMAAISETLGGKFSNLEDASQALQKQFGDALNPVMIDLIDIILDVMDNLGPFQDAYREVGDTIGGLIDSVGELISSFVDMGDEGIETSDVMGILAKGVQIASIPLKLIVGTITLAVDAFRILVNEAKKAANFFGAEFEVDTTLTVGKLKEDVLKMAEAFNPNSNPQYAAERKKANEENIQFEAELDKKREEEKGKAAQREFERAEAKRKKDEEAKRKAAEKAYQDALKMEFENQALRISLMQEGAGKELATLNLNYEKQKNALRDNKTGLLLIEKKYLEDLNKLQEDELDAELERQLASQKNEQDFTEKFKAMQDEELDAEIERQLAGIEQDKEFNERRLQDAQTNSANRVALEESTFAALTALGDALIQDEQQRAEFQKTIALFQLGVKTAEAIASGVAAAQSVPYPGNLIAIATTVAAVLANIAQARALLSTSAVPSPGFAEGVVDLQGPGTGTSDSITARLSRGESVITADRTRAFKDELMAMNYGDYDALILKKYVMPALREDRKIRDTASSMATSLQLQGLFDDSRIVGTLERNKPATAKDIRKLGSQFEKTFRDAAYRQSKMWKA